MEITPGYCHHVAQVCRNKRLGVEEVAANGNSPIQAQAETIAVTARHCYNVGKLGGILVCPNSFLPHATTTVRRNAGVITFAKLEKSEYPKSLRARTRY